MVDISSNCFVFFQLLTAKLLEIWAHCANTDMEMLSAFIDSSVDNVLLQTNPDFTSQFLNLNISERYLIDTLFYDSQTL